MESIRYFLIPFAYNSSLMPWVNGTYYINNHSHHRQFSSSTSLVQLYKSEISYMQYLELALYIPSFIYNGSEFIPTSTQVERKSTPQWLVICCFFYVMLFINYFGLSLMICVIIIELVYYHSFIFQMMLSE